MTLEEKAKAYDEALEKIQPLYEQAKSNDNPIWSTYEHLFPQLAESEDERVRKLLVWQVYRNIEDETNDLAGSVYNGIKGHDPDLEESIDDWKKCLVWLEKHKEQKPDVEICPHSIKGKSYSEDCGTTVVYTGDESEYDKECRVRRPDRYKIGKTFMGLIPCWVNAPSELQPAHKYHGKNAVIMHETNGGFRCCFIDDEKATTIHLPENTPFVEGWIKKRAEWSEEDEKFFKTALWHISYSVSNGKNTDEHCDTTDWLRGVKERLKSFRPQPQGTYKQVIHTIFGMLKDKDLYEIQPSHRVSLLNDIRVKCKDAIECAPILDEPLEGTL